MKIVVADLYCPLFGFLRPQNNSSEWTGKIIDWSENQFKIIEREGSTAVEIYNSILESPADEILAFTNSDSVLNERELEIIHQLHDKHNAYDILIFQVLDSNRRWLRHYKLSEFDLDENSINRVLPFEITVKTRNFRYNGIKFCKLFGPGGYFQYDLHKVFLSDAIKKGLKIKYVPYTFTIQNLDVDNRIGELPLERFYSAGAALCYITDFDTVPQYLNHYLNKVANTEFETQVIQEKYYFRAETFLKGANDYKSLTK